MSMLSFALMKPFTPKYSIHYDDNSAQDEENGSLCPSSDDENAPPDHPKNSHKVYRYMNRDAIINRATFLIVVGLIVIFSICVARDGAIDNMEWLRKQLTMDYVSIEKNRGDIWELSNLVAHGGFGPKIPLLLVIGVDTEVSPNSWKPILSYLTPGFRDNGLNTSAVLWGKNSTYPAENCVYDNTWTILTMSSINASTPENLINYLTEIMKVSVFYLDADAVSKDLFTSGGSSFNIDIYQLFPPNGASEDIILAKYRWIPPTTTVTFSSNNGSIPQPTTTTTTTSSVEPRDDILQPPLVPLIDPSLMVVWNTVPAVTLFRDAAAWQHTVDVHRKEQGLETSSLSSSSSFILNMLLNDGQRHVQSEAVWGDGLGTQRISEDVLKFRIYRVWNMETSLPSKSINQVLPVTEKCQIQGAMCCLQF